MGVRDITLSQLAAFRAVSEHGAVTAAAQALHLTVSAVSRQVSALEQHLGVMLLNRSGGRVTLTREGLLFSHRIGPPLDAMNRVFNMYDVISTDANRPLRFGYVESLVYGVLPLLYEAAHQQKEGLVLFSQEMHSQEIVPAIVAKDLDFGIIRHGEQATKLNMRYVGTESLVAVVPEGFEDFDAIESISALAEHPFVFYDEAVCSSLSSTVKAAALEAGFEPKLARYASGTSELFAIVGGGGGISVLPASFARFPRPRIRFVPINGKSLSSDLFLCWDREDLSPLLTVFGAVIRRALISDGGN